MNTAVLTQGIMHRLGELCENKKVAKKIRNVEPSFGLVTSGSAVCV